MRKIFVFWIVFLIVLIAGIFLVLFSKLTLKKEERQTEQLRRSSQSRSLRASTVPTAGEKKIVMPVDDPKKEAVVITAPAALTQESVSNAPAMPQPANLAPPENIPVEINTNSLEMDIPPIFSERQVSLPEGEEKQRADDLAEENQVKE